MSLTLFVSLSQLLKHSVSKRYMCSTHYRGNNRSCSGACIRRSETRSKQMGLRHETSGHYLFTLRRAKHQTVEITEDKPLSLVTSDTWFVKYVLGPFRFGQVCKYAISEVIFCTFIQRRFNKVFFLFIKLFVCILCSYFKFVCERLTSRQETVARVSFV